MAKSKSEINLYRNPSYKGGLCSCCRLRLRNSGHPDYPHMCGQCLKTRKALQPTTSLSQLEVDRAIEIAAHTQKVNELTLGVNDPRNDPIFLVNVYNKLNEDERAVMDKTIDARMLPRSNSEHSPSPNTTANVDALVKKLLN